MISLSMLVSLIETAIKEKTIDKMYGDFLEEAVKMGLSSYTLNVLIVNAKKRIENGDNESNDDTIIPFLYKQDIIKPKIKIEHKIQEKIVYKTRKGYILLNIGLILSLFITCSIVFLKNNEIKEFEGFSMYLYDKITEQKDSLRITYDLAHRLKGELSNITKFKCSTGASIRDCNSSDNGWIMWVKANTPVKITSFYVKGGGSSNGDIVLAIYDTNDNLIATNKAVISNSEFKQVILNDNWRLTPGFYYIRIKESNGKTLQYHSSNDKEYAQFTGGALEVTGCSSYSDRNNVSSRNKHGFYQYFYNIQYEIIPNVIE